MKKILKPLFLSSTAVVAILVTAFLQKYGIWTTILIDLLLSMLFMYAIFNSLRLLKWWSICVFLATLCLKPGFKVKHSTEGRIQIVSRNPINTTIYAEGCSIDTIRFRIGYNTFGGLYYNISVSDLYAIQDSCQLTTVIVFYNDYVHIVARGQEMHIEDYQGPHGIINIFSYIDDSGKRIRRDYYGHNPDEETYAVKIYDNLDYIQNNP